MEGGLFITVLAVLCGIGFLAYRAWEYSRWDKGRTIEELRASHPRSFIKGRFMACPFCEGKVMRVMRYRGGALKKYVCKGCGRELWRTKE